MPIEQDMTKTPRPSHRQVCIEEVDGDRLELSYARRQWCAGGFFLLGWILWTVLTVSSLWTVFTDPRVEFILIAGVLISGWFALSGLLVWWLIYTERVRLSSEGLEYRAAALVTLSRRTIPRTELKNVRAGVTEHEENDEYLRCLKFEAMGQPLRFATGISEPEQRWLVERLNAYLDMLDPHGSPGRRNAAPILAPENCQGEILQRKATPVEPPSDSRIKVRYGVDTVAFVWKGKWSLAAIAGTILLNLFLNGLVGLFICVSPGFGVFRWGLFVILIPFAALGLYICALLFVRLTAPLWSLTWTFSEREATRRLGISDADAVVFAFGWSKRFRIQPPVRIELRHREGEKPSLSLGNLLSHPNGEYTLSFLNGEDKELLAIKHLTEGDARWIADVLLRIFPSWSRSEQSTPHG